MTNAVIYEGRKFRIERRIERQPDGAETTRDLMVHPGAAVILPLLDDQRVLMEYNYRPTVGAELLELPAGTLDPPESPLECARRELAEETGYTATHWSPLLTFYPTPGVSTELMHVFVARGLTPGPMHHEPDERIRVTTLALADALAAIGDGRIRDAKTIVALLYYDRRRPAAG